LSEDKTICLWDTLKGDKILQAHSIFSGHDSVIEDISWHSRDEHSFVSVGDDRVINIWDLRSKSVAQSRKNAHGGDINSAQFHPLTDFLLATSSTDKTIGLWDVRNLRQILHTLEAHEDIVSQVKWAPTNIGEDCEEEARELPTILASSSEDGTVKIWDLRKIGEEQNEEEAEEGPPELLFSHTVHEPISDLCWNPNHPWLIANVDINNELQIWKMAETIYLEDEFNFQLA